MDNSGRRPINLIQPSRPLRLSQSFGNSYYNSSEDISNPGDPFTTADKAAHAAAIKYNQKSIDNNLEYVCAIYFIDSLALYPHCDPILFPGAFNLPSVMYSYTSPYIGDAESSTIPAHPQRVAAIHTHGAENTLLYGSLGSRVFSEKDKEVAAKFNILLYLANPYGELKLYNPNDPTWDENYVITIDHIPYDPTTR